MSESLFLIFVGYKPSMLWYNWSYKLQFNDYLACIISLNWHTLGLCQNIWCILFLHYDQSSEKAVKMCMMLTIDIHDVSICISIKTVNMNSWFQKCWNYVTGKKIRNFFKVAYAKDKIGDSNGPSGASCSVEHHR